MSVTISEFVPNESNMRSHNEDGRRANERNPEHKEELLGDGKPKTSDKLLHTAKGLEAIGFNEHASMFHQGYRHYSVDSQKSSPHNSDPNKAPKERKRTMSFIKKLIGGGNGKEKGERM